MLELLHILEDGDEFIEYVDAEFLTLDHIVCESNDGNAIEILSYRPELYQE